MAATSSTLTASTAAIGKGHKGRMVGLVTGTALGLALLAGRGLERLPALRPRPALGGLVVGLLVAELFVRPGSAQVDIGDEVLAVNEALDDLDPGAVTELPVHGPPPARSAPGGPAPCVRAAASRSGRPAPRCRSPRRAVGRW